MIDRESYDDVVSTLYGTVAEPATWDAALASLQAAFDAKIVSLNTRYRNSYQSLSTAPSVSDYFIQQWAWANPYKTTDIMVGDVALGRDLVDQESLLASAYYNEFVLPADIPQLMSIRAAASVDSGAIVNILRGRQQPELTATDVDLARRLGAHIVNALGAAAALGWKSWSKLTKSLETEHDAMLLVDHAGMILHMNRAARALIEAGDGITVNARGLHAAIGDGKRLRLAIWQAASAPAPRSGTRLTIERPLDSRPLIASITPLDEDLTDIGVPQPRALIAILNPTRAAPSPIGDLQRLFGLTRREAEIAQALTEDLTIGEAAQRCGVTVVTARNYLARVLRKTELNRQCELVVLLNRVARLRSDAN